MLGKRKIAFAWGVAIGLAGGSVQAQPYHIGLDFIDQTIEGLTIGNSIWIPQMNPFDVTAEGNEASSAGGWAGMASEAEARRQIALRVEDHFRGVPTGDPDTTLGIAIYDQAVPASEVGRRLNLAMGAFDPAPYLGIAILNGAISSEIADDDFAAAIFLNELDELGSQGADLSSLPNVLNVFGGTISHEIGHLFGLDHMVPGSVEPYPLMASGSDGLQISDRTTDRWFTDLAGAQGGASSSQSALVSAIPAVHRADFDMDGDVDLNDGGRLITAFGMSHRLFQEGDTNGDHLVDLDDAALLISAFGSSGTSAIQGAAQPSADNALASDTAGAGDAQWTYDAVAAGLSTQMTVDAVNMAFLSTQALDGATLELVQQAVGFSTAQAGPGIQVGEFMTGDFITGQALIDISVLEAGIYHFEARWNTVGGQEQLANFTIQFVPEPSSLALHGFGGLLLARRRRRG